MSDSLVPEQPPAIASAPTSPPPDPSTGADCFPQNSSDFPTRAETSAQHSNPISTDLTPRQLAAIDLMLAGNPDTKIAEILNLDRKTLYNWRTHNPRFRQALDQRRADLYASHLDRFLLAISHSIDTLHRQATDCYVPTSHRAAKTLLSQSRLGQHLYNLANPPSQIPKPQPTPQPTPDPGQPTTDS